MKTNRIAWIAAALAILAVPAMAGGECAGKQANAEKTHACCQGGHEACGAADCPHGTGASEAAQVANAAAGGCAASKTKMIAMAKESGNEQAAALAVKAENGCQESTDALIALMRQPSPTTSMAQLATAAEHGCAKSTTELIQMAKASKDQEMVTLATAAEGGCEHSKSALIARAKTLDAPAMSQN